MVKFGTYTLPLVLNKQEIFLKLYVRRDVPGGSLSKTKVCGTIGSEFSLSGLIEEGESTVAEQIAALKALADGTARSLDFQNGSDPITCLMVNPTFRESGKPNQALWEALFIQSA